jgi:hypothetical protein
VAHLAQVDQRVSCLQLDPHVHAVRCGTGRHFRLLITLTQSTLGDAGHCGFTSFVCAVTLLYQAPVTSACRFMHTIDPRTCITLSTAGCCGSEQHQYAAASSAPVFAVLVQQFDDHACVTLSRCLHISAQLITAASSASDCAGWFVLARTRYPRTAVTLSGFHAIDVSNIASSASVSGARCLTPYAARSTHVCVTHAGSLQLRAAVSLLCYQFMVAVLVVARARLNPRTCGCSVRCYALPAAVHFDLS